jgi:tetratricopeptide (TPR) repeat protein
MCSGAIDARRGLSFVSMPGRPLAVALALVLLSVGCAAAPTATPARPAARRERPSVVLNPVVVSPYSDAELAEQFERARSLLLSSRPREAAEIFDRLTRLAPDGEVAPPSLLNAGIAYEDLRDPSAAADRYREVLRRFPEHTAARGALVRLARAAAYLERWEEVVQAADRLLARDDLTVLEAIEARGVRALGLIQLDRLDEAAREVARARDVIEEHRLGESGKPPVELAQVSFALGEVRRRRSEAIRLSPLPPDFTDALERRCQGLLDAQNAYTDAMRSLDAHWSAMAGYRIGRLYQDLHRELMQIPPPASAGTLRQKQLFEGAMRLRYRVLLEKGKKMMDGTVALGERTGETSAWIRRAREAQREIDLALADEKAALARLPFTEAELQAALDALKKP